jgi:glutamyl-tRNA synthetase/glutamyl-Q tRNA(Asp) synthetase
MLGGGLKSPYEWSMALPRPPTTRFAPSPTGFLHLGHVASALYVWGVARAYGARVLLRIEDHDLSRCRPEYERAIHEDLAWLGLSPDAIVPRQSERDAAYRAALATLASTGGVYACDCSRKTIEAATGGTGEELRYPGTCRARQLALDAPGVGLRTVVADEEIVFFDKVLGRIAQRPAAQCGDLLIRDRHRLWTYQLCVVVDDLEQGVDLVVRGQDLTSSTGRQIQLARRLGRTTDASFLHHPLITDPSGRKLGKRFFSEAIAKRRAAGETSAAIIGEAAFHVGLLAEPRPATLTEVWDAVDAGLARP